VDAARSRWSFSATIAAWGRTSESAGHINCIAKLAEARLAARPDDFDADPLLLNVLNGTIVFRRPEGDFAASAELREHRREDRMTKIGRAEYDPRRPARLRRLPGRGAAGGRDARLPGCVGRL
jgi:phage/plasmid-associated DNA primase